jgi:hypothetical protein
MCAKCGHAGPFLDDHEGIIAVFGGESSISAIDRSAVLDAAVFFQNRWDIGFEQFQHVITHSGFGGDDGKHMDARHENFLPVQTVAESVSSQRRLSTAPHGARKISLI